MKDHRYLNDLPTNRSDLFHQVHDQPPLTVPQAIFDAEAEAEQASIRLLIELKRDAEAKVAAFSQPSPPVKERDRQHLLAEAQRHLDIATAGLTILNLSPEQIERLEEFRQA